MSKEQTPITAEEIKRAIESGNVEKVLTIMERYSQAYAQAKVLEALERELIEFHCGCMELGLKKDESVFIKSQWREKVRAVAKEYYEKEVKPKYKL